jgi:hypothetical protein
MAGAWPSRLHLDAVVGCESVYSENSHPLWVAVLLKGGSTEVFNPRKSVSSVFISGKVLIFQRLFYSAYPALKVQPAIVYSTRTK